MNPTAGQNPQITTLQSRTARLREALSGFGAFLAAAHRADPLPTLQDLACDWLRAETLEIHVPAGTGPLQTEDKLKLCGPVLIRRRVVGRIEARRNRPFDEDDRALLAALGQLIGAALEHAALQAHLSERDCAVQTQADTLDTLLTFARDVVNGTNDPLKLARWVVAQVPGMVGGERASVLLLPVETSDEPMLVLGNGTCATPERAREVVEHGLAGLVLHERAPMIIDETDTDQRWIGMRLSQNDTRTRCAMAVPLLWNHCVVGAMTVTTSESHLFNTTQLNLLELVACHVSLALHTSNLDARLAATAASLGAMARYLEMALPELRAGNLAALDTIAAVAERLREEQLALSRTGPRP